MTDFYPILSVVLLAAVAIAAIVSGARRERELLKLIRNLQNRIQAKDLAGYMELERQDRAAPPRPKEEAEELVHQVLSERFTPADGMTLP